METRSSKRLGSKNNALTRPPLRHHGKRGFDPDDALLNGEEEMDMGIEEEMDMGIEEETEMEFEEETMENADESPVAETAKASVTKPQSDDIHLTYKELNEKVLRMRTQHNNEKVLRMRTQHNKEVEEALRMVQHNKENENLLRMRTQRNKEKKSPSSQTKRLPNPQIIPQSSMNRESFGSSCLKSLSMWLIFGLCLLIAGATGYILRMKPNLLLKLEQPELDVEGIMSGLKGTFAGQDPMTFRIVEKALKRVNQPEPESPAIIILLAAKGAENLSHDFAQKLVKAISPDYLNISGDDYRTVSTDIGKKDIDEKIRSGLNENELKAVLVGNLDHIPSQTAIMFYSFCDHENAPYKRVVYVMTLTAKQEFPKKYDGNKWDNAVQDHLLTVWSDTHEDKIAPLLSRLTVSVAAIQTISKNAISNS